MTSAVPRTSVTMDRRIAFEFSVSLAAISHQDILGLAITGFAIKGFLDVDNLGLFEGGNTCPKLGKTTSPGGRRVVYYADAESGAQGAGLYVEGLDTGIVIHTGFKPTTPANSPLAPTAAESFSQVPGFCRYGTSWRTRLHRFTPMARYSAALAPVPLASSRTAPALTPR